MRFGLQKREPASLAHLEPFDELRRMSEAMNRVFGGIEPLFGRSMPEYYSPYVDILDGENEIVATIDMPGVSKDEIEINIKGDSLEVKAEREEEAEEKGECYICKEREINKFYRMMRLPSSVKEDEVKAKYENGVLKITMPKIEVEVKKIIPIE